MNKNNKEEILRLINNRFYEHGHPFKHGKSGMEDFCKLTVMLQESGDKEFKEFMDIIEGLFEETRKCKLCECKLRCFMSVFYQHIDPKKSIEHLTKVILITQNIETKRDFWKEVYSHMKNYIDEDQFRQMEIDKISEAYSNLQTMINDN